MFDHEHHFLNRLIEFGRVPWMELNHHWHGINVLSILEFTLIAATFFSILTLLGALVRESKRFIAISIAGALSFSTAAYAANTALSNLSASGALAGANLIYVVQTAGSGGVKATMTQVATFINSLFSGDFTCTSGGACTLKNTGPGATGPLGSATTAPVVTIDAQGRVTALTSTTVTPAVGSVTGLGTGVATALGTNVGTAGSPVVNGGVLGTPSSGTLTNASGLPVSGLTGLGTGVATALGTNVGSAGSVVVNGGALGSPSSVGTLPAHTLGGTISGGGNQINNVIIGTTTPLSATFTNLSATGTTVLSATTLSNIIGSIQCLHVSSAGAVTGTGSDCGSGSGGVTSIAGNTGAFTLNATTGLTNATNDIQCEQGSASQFGCVKADNSTITAASGVLTAVPGLTKRTVTSGPDTILAADRGNVVYYNSASSIAVSQPAPSGSFASGFFTELCNINSGIATVTPGSGTIINGATYAIPAGTAASPSCVQYQSDGTNFNATDLLPTYGTNVISALSKTLSVAGGITQTIATGTATIPATQIASGACGSAITVAATNVLTADVVSAGFSADPTGTTGFLPTAMLTIVPYPTVGNANFKVCNLTTSALTPTSLTFNWSVKR